MVGPQIPSTFDARDDRFHPSDSRDPMLTETVWWNFYLPERNIDAEIYLNFRPNLGVTSAGIYCWSRFCRHFTDALHFDARSYLPLPKGDLDDFELANGLRMRVIEPLSKYEIAYLGTRGVTLELQFTALAAPVGFTTPSMDPERASFAPGHFDQVGRMTGRLVLPHDSFDIDCITQRDRSWGGSRREDPEYPPDVGWHSAHFGSDLWLQCWLWHQEPVANDLQAGIVYKQGRPVRIVKAERRTVLDEGGVEARTIDLQLTDEEGQDYRLRGTVRNMFPWPGWFNMVGFAGLVQWELDGRIGWGEVHDGRRVDGVIAHRQAAGRTATP
ncbi:MAG: hypothetical protein JWN85_670 [Gammaproteobacteria bacterium]|nr:hypothetical protein [Gammaproteobacteria bacterium]